jgi:TPR repeat protein
VPLDYARARQWFEKAAVQEHAGAQYNLGRLYENGQGVPEDYKKARQLWEQAAAQGYAPAQHAIGSLYEKGQGVQQDDVRAYMWYKIAAAYLTGADQKLAAENPDKVVRCMTPAQIAEAQRLAQQCEARQFKGC